MARIDLHRVNVRFPIYYAGTRSLLRMLWRREWHDRNLGNRPMHRVALQDVDAMVSPGEIVLLTGPGGGGKLTLLRVMGGMLPVVTGRVAIQARRIGCVFAPALYHRRQSIRDTVAMEGLRYGIALGASSRQLPAILAFAGLDLDPCQDAASLLAPDLLKLTLACAVEFGCDLLLIGSMIEDVETAFLTRLLDAVRARDPDAVLVLETTDPALLPATGARVIHVQDGRVDPRADIA